MSKSLDSDNTKINNSTTMVNNEANIALTLEANRAPNNKSSIIKNIDKEIEHKKNSLDITRNCRVMFAKRMYNKYTVWSFTFFITNCTAIFIFLMSVYKDSTALSYYSGVYSIYVILLQYTTNYYKYYEAHELTMTCEKKIESSIYKLKSLFRSEKSDIEKESEYMVIMDDYLKDLEFYPNHSDVDVKLSNLLKLKNNSFWSMLNFLFYMYIGSFFAFINIIVAVVIIISTYNTTI